VHDIVNFVSTEEYLSELLDFDPQMFFQVIAKLFKDKPWQFMSQMADLNAECNIDPSDMLPLFETQGHKAKNISNSDEILDCFYAFVL
jgi:hypothetical protein